MPPLLAATISLGFLGAIATYITATIFPVPLWVAFIVCASFVGTSAATNTIGMSGLSHLTLIVLGAVLLKGGFGVVSEMVPSPLVGSMPKTV